MLLNAQRMAWPGSCFLCTHVQRGCWLLLLNHYSQKHFCCFCLYTDNNHSKPRHLTQPHRSLTDLTFVFPASWGRLCPGCGECPAVARCHLALQTPFFPFHLPRISVSALQDSQHLCKLEVFLCVSQEKACVSSSLESVIIIMN